MSYLLDIRMVFGDLTRLLLQSRSLIEFTDCQFQAVVEACPERFAGSLFDQFATRKRLTSAVAMAVPGCGQRNGSVRFAASDRFPVAKGGLRG
jgi:hypothetical protein